MEKDIRNGLRKKSRIVVKVGSSSLTHPETGNLDFNKLEVLVRELTDLKNRGKDVILVSSGAIMVGRNTLNHAPRPQTLAEKQAFASIGQAKLMMIYQKLFSEYNQICSQVLMTKHTILNPVSRCNARNTFNELLTLHAIPIVNENDTVSTDEIEIGDNDTLSAVVAALTGADLLIILSDIEGLYSDDPHQNPEARFISYVERLDENLEAMAKGSSSSVGTGGMSTKIKAAKIAASAGADLIIASAKDFHILHDLIEGHDKGTIFAAHENPEFIIEEVLTQKGNE